MKHIKKSKKLTPPLLEFESINNIPYDKLDIKKDLGMKKGNAAKGKELKPSKWPES